MPVAAPARSPSARPPRAAGSALLGAVALLAAACAPEPHPDPPPGPYDPVAFVDALGRIEAWLREHRPDVAATLRPGLERDALLARAEALPVALPPEVIDLYTWHDGADSHATFVEYHRFPPFDDVVAAHAEWVALTRATPFRWNRTWIPLFLFQEEALAVRAGPEPRAGLAVWHHLLEDPDPVLAYPSLQRLVEMWADAYESGAVSVDDRGGLVYDEAALAVLRARYARP